jgi:hypothetical protein
MMSDLFGAPYVVTDPPRTLKRRVLGKYRYRKRENRAVCCGTCANHFVHLRGRAYQKCRLLGDSRCAATDIRMRNVCDAWKEPESHELL